MSDTKKPRPLGTLGLPATAPGLNETIVKLALLREDSTYWTAYATLYVDPSDHLAVQRVKDEWVRTLELDGSVKWSVIVEDHDTLMEILEGVWD